MTVESSTSTKGRGLERWLEYLTLAVFAILTGITVYLHEPWSDEANSWLLARDATLTELWGHLMHYEGTPGLWQTILHVLIRVGFPYAALNCLSGAMGCAAAWLMVRKSPLPIYIRLTIPFTFYLFFQYSIVARSYCLLPILLFACAWLYPQAGERLGAMTLLLALMAGVSVHGMILSGAIWLSLYWNLMRMWRGLNAAWRWKILYCAAGYGVVCLLMAWSAWPATDVTFAKTRDYSLDHLLEATSETLSNAYTGEWISSLAAILLCLPFFWRGRGLLMFVVATLGLLAFNAYVYANVWHEGMPLLAWIFALWISGRAAKPKWIQIPAVVAMVGVIAVQGYWAYETTAYDWENPYSGARNAASYLREHKIDQAGIEGFGFACVALQPYFDRNIFSNFRNGNASAYWDWSEAWRNFGELEEVNEKKPAYVIVGYKTEEDKILMGRAIRKSGYQLVRNFEGSLYWHDDVLEPDGFDLYKRR